MGDFNAKVDIANEDTGQVMGKHSLAKRNERGERLIDFCCANNLFTTNTKFKQSKENRIWTWESSGGRYHNQIDYILVSERWVSSIKNSRLFPSADCWSEHQLILANIQLKQEHVSRECGKWM